MAQFFYDGQIRRYLTQFMRLMSNFCVQDSAGNIKQVPVRYGDTSRQVAQIINQNSENIINSAPFIACWIKDLKFNRSMMQDPTFIGKLQIRERAWDEGNQEYLNIQGANYTVERIMPTPYKITFQSDIWTTNTDQKLQLWEQITVLFNPSMELQASDNYIDWTSLSVLEISDGSVFESRTVPQGLNNDISIATLQFEAPIWITPPAKIKKMGIITKIISNVFLEPMGTGENGGYEDVFTAGDIFGQQTPDARVTITHKDYSLLVLNNIAVLVPKDYTDVSEDWISVDDVPGRPSWLNLLDLYPGKFAPGLSQLRLLKADGTEVIAYMTLNSLNESLMNLTFDVDTVPQNTILTIGPYSRGTIDAIVNPLTYNSGVSSGTGLDKRLLILEDVVLNNTVDGPDAWSSVSPVTGQPNGITANANDIVQWDGTKWNILFNAAGNTSTTYITNSYTGIQYKWDGNSWTKSFEGVYENYDWRLIL